MKAIGSFNFILIIITFLVLIFLSFFSVINRNFKTSDSMLAFLKEANVYSNISSIIKLDIQGSYPAVIKNNIVVNGLADKLLEAVVTPSLVERFAAPAVKLSVKFANSPTSIIDKKVVVATAKYKKQALQAIADFGLPKFVVVNAGLLVDSVPPYLTIVNNEKHPNNIFALIIKMRTILAYNKTALQVSWVAIIALILILVVHNLTSIKRLLLVLGITFGIAGSLIIILNLMLPTIMSMLIPSSLDPAITAQNKLITDAVATLVGQILRCSFIYVILAVISCLIWKFVNLARFQTRVDKTFRHIHVPAITVKIKN